MKKTYCLFLCCLTVLGPVVAQDVRLSNSDSVGKKELVDDAFKSSRIIMSHCIQMLRPGTFDFRILHRFGYLNSGFDQFFGLDQATMRMSFDFGISRNLTIGIGRSTYRKEADAFAKYRLVQQSIGEKAFPVSIVAIGGTTVLTGKAFNASTKKPFTDRMGYYGQLLLGRKFSEKLSLQISPMIVHENIVQNTADDNDLYSLGAGGRIKVSRRIALTADYFYVFNLPLQMHHPLSLGIDIETGGHVFQLHFTNAVGMNEKAFIAETTNSWGKGQIQFGFNLSRIFSLKKR